MITPRMIAAYYGVEVTFEFLDDLRACLDQSRANAGKQGLSRLDYFDSYMSDIIAETNAAEMADRDFARRAY